MLSTKGTGALTKRHWSKEEISAQVERRMSHFYEAGLQPGERVVIGYGNKLEFFADLLAIWQLGACAIPMDARLTSFEVDNLARVAEPRLYLYYESLDTELKGKLTERKVTLIDSAAIEASSGPSASSISYSLDDKALILFTSGTTGDPKGVVHSHRSLRARWITLRQSLGLEAYERTLCLLPTHFGHGLICNCLFPWLAGCDLYILPPFDPTVLMKLGSILDEHEITFMSSVPSMWRMTLKTSKPPTKGSIRRISCGSAPLSAHLWQQILDWSNAPEVLNACGITETGSWVAGTSIGKFEPRDGLVGVPWGAEILITKTGTTEVPPQQLEACEVGETGFVWLNTPALMCGYYQRDDLTAAAANQGWFMTGDLGAIDENRHLYLRSRVREEINKGGAKIYPADIDAMAEQFPAVRDMCCFQVKDEFYGQNIGLALVMDDQEPETLRKLHSWLSDHLAEHQMPVQWFLLEEIPRTSRGKVNRDTVAEHCESCDPVDLRKLLREESRVKR
ncbi:MAG: class I adenylate-forming enzyme family protein [Opitutales bacterium]|nr:class I adenylate-forming enzyme family protein [Opitutales bacterium]